MISKRSFILAAGTAIGGSYQVKYKPEPGTTVAMEPGAYDVLSRSHEPTN